MYAAHDLRQRHPAFIRTLVNSPAIRATILVALGLHSEAADPAIAKVAHLDHLLSSASASATAPMNRRLATHATAAATVSAIARNVTSRLRASVTAQPTRAVGRQSGQGSPLASRRSV